jgi:hypothetical protein
MVAVELFMFTDNFVTKWDYFQVTSTSLILFGLVLWLRILEMHMGWNIHVIHVAGTPIIEQGTDGISRGDMMTGVMGGADMLSFFPLTLTSIKLQDNLGDASWM